MHRNFTNKNIVLIDKILNIRYNNIKMGEKVIFLIKIQIIIEKNLKNGGS